MPTVIFWFHQDLRIKDNPGLVAAAADGNRVLPVYILDDEAAGDWKMGGAARWWLYHSLARLGETLAGLGAPLVLAQGRAEEILPRLARQCGADAIHASTRHEPWAQEQMERVRDAFGNTIKINDDFEAVRLVPPGTVTGKSTGRPLQVFTPFKKSLLGKAEFLRDEIPAPISLTPAETIPESSDLDALGLLPRAPDWSGGLQAAWQPGEAAAHDRLENFIASRRIDAYATARDIPGVGAAGGTSRLAPHLHFGEISPITIYHRIHERLTGGNDGAGFFLSEVIWREFSYDLLHQFPRLPERNLREQFNDFPWATNPEHLDAWQRGKTGFPLVDAGMRELRTTGSMHNRVRMITASFLTKHLRIHWLEGARWFWDNLVDADLASNSANWQWVAGCGADAAPYFRIFNPITQGKKFSAHDYVRHWMGDEVTGRKDATLFAPLDHAIVEHETAREAALAAFGSIKSRGK